MNFVEFSIYFYVINGITSMESENHITLSVFLFRTNYYVYLIWKYLSGDMVLSIAKGRKKIHKEEYLTKLV